MCEWKPDFDRLDERVDAIESRLTTIETASSMTRESIIAVNANIETLSQQMTNMDARLVEEKAKWGDVFRRLVTWTVKALLVTALAAAGVNLAQTIIK